MALQFEYTFVVKAPVDGVWAYLTDPFRVAPALPGATITEKLDDRTYAGTITVKVGPVSARYKGTARFETLDPASHTAEMVASAQDVSGRGGASMKMTSRMAERPGGETEISVVAEVNVTGILAQFGRGLMQDVSNQMFQRFTEAVRAELEKPVAGAPAFAAAAGADTAAAPGAVVTPALPMTPAAALGAPAPAPAAPIEVLSFGSQVAGQALRRGLRQPAFWVISLVVVLFIYWFWIR